MDIDKPLRHLGDVDTTALRDAILTLDRPVWAENKYRQVTYEVHDDTESIVLVFCDGEWPDVEVSRESGWDHLAAHAVPLMTRIIEQHYPRGGTVIRAMAAKLVAGGRITPHFDSHPTFKFGHRIHIPITTNRLVRFMIDGRPYQFEVGKAYEINNLLNHSVMNRGTEDRITFIFDYVPPASIESGPLPVSADPTSREE